LSFFNDNIEEKKFINKDNMVISRKLQEIENRKNVNLFFIKQTNIKNIKKIKIQIKNKTKLFNRIFT